jgi:MFS family permease
MAIGALAGVLTYLAYAASTVWWMALVGPALLAVEMALTIPSYYAYIGDLTDARPQVRGRVFGFSEAARTIAWILAPPLGGWLAYNLGSRWMFAAAAATAAAAAALLIPMARGARAAPAGEGRAASFASLRLSLSQTAALAVSGGLLTWILLTDGFRDSALKLSIDLMPVYLTDVAGLTKQYIGLLDGMFGAAWVAASYPAGWLVDRTSERAAIVLGILGQLFSVVVFILATGFWGFAFSWILLGMGGATLEPAFSSLIARGVPQRVRGVSYGLVATSLGLFALPFPWLGGQLWAAFGPRVTFLTTIAVALVAIVPAWVKLRPAPVRPSAGS